MTSADTFSDAKRTLVVIQRNPNSGSGRGRVELIRLIRELRVLGFHVRMFSARSKLDVCVMAPQPRQTLRCIVAAGGDGTVADLVNRHPGVPIAILPLGTENLLAGYLGLRRCGTTLAHIIARGRFRSLDSGVANGRRFLLMCSMGVDAYVVHAIHHSRTGTIRRLGYVWPTLRAFFNNRPGCFRATSVDGRASVSGTHLICTNVPAYGFGLSFAPDARPDDGILDVRAFIGTTRWQIFLHAVKLKLGLPIGRNEVERMQADSVNVELVAESTGVFSQCDGDPGPKLPLHIVVDPGSLTVVVP